MPTYYDESTKTWFCKFYYTDYTGQRSRKSSAIMNYAVTYYPLPSNPCHKAGTMGKIVHSMNFWTLDQYNSFIQYMSNIRIHAAFQVLFIQACAAGKCWHSRKNMPIKYTESSCKTGFLHFQRNPSEGI